MSDKIRVYYCTKCLNKANMKFYEGREPAFYCKACERSAIGVEEWNKGQQYFVEYDPAFFEGLQKGADEDGWCAFEYGRGRSFGPDSEPKRVEVKE